jgi:predicted N-acetyltransferase YhbS
MTVSVREVRATGLEAVLLAGQVLQRARRADLGAGVWEAADAQWWWRKPRPSDQVEKIFWVDDDGPVAGMLLTCEADGSWQCDPVVVPGASGPEPEVVWGRALEEVARHTEAFQVPMNDDDEAFRDLAERSGLTAGEHDSTAWMDATGRPAVRPVPEGYVLVDHSQRGDAPHPMQHRNGKLVAERLAQCPLYDPALDLAIETGDGRQAAYALFWFDPTTRLGLVEPVRVEDEFQRQGLARTMLATGLDRLVSRGAQRVKISYSSETAGALYQAVGFRPTSTATWYHP